MRKMKGMTTATGMTMLTEGLDLEGENEKVYSFAV